MWLILPKLTLLFVLTLAFAESNHSDIDDSIGHSSTSTTPSSSSRSYSNGRYDDDDDDSGSDLLARFICFVAIMLSIAALICYCRHRRRQRMLEQVVVIHPTNIGAGHPPYIPASSPSGYPQYNPSSAYSQTGPMYNAPSSTQYQPPVMPSKEPSAPSYYGKKI